MRNSATLQGHLEKKLLTKTCNIFLDSETVVPLMVTSGDLS